MSGIEENFLPMRYKIKALLQGFCFLQLHFVATIKETWFVHFLSSMFQGVTVKNEPNSVSFAAFFSYNYVGLLQPLDSIGLLLMKLPQEIKEISLFVRIRHYDLNFTFFDLPAFFVSIKNWGKIHYFLHLCHEI